MKIKKTLYWAALVAVALVVTAGLKIAENGNRCAKVEQVVKSYLVLDRVDVP